MHYPLLHYCLSCGARKRELLRCRRASETAGGHGNLSAAGFDAAERGTLAAGQGVESRELNVEAGAGAVDGEDVDGAAIVAQLPACTALGRVPAANGSSAADELGADLALCLPAVSGDEAVGAVRAGDGGQRAAGIVVAGVVRDSDGGGRGGEEGEGREDGGELHDGGGCLYLR